MPRTRSSTERDDDDNDGVGVGVGVAERLAELQRLTPSSYVDPVTPWVMPFDGEQKIVASGLWLSFTFSSALVHSFGLLMFLGFVPLSLSFCGSTVKPVPKPETVEVAMVMVPPPPPPLLPPPPPPPPPKPERAPRSGREAARIGSMLSVISASETSGILAVLGNDHGAEIGDALNSIHGGEFIEGGVLGGVVGGVGGGGIVGSSSGRGAGDVGGLGGLGMVSRGTALTVVADSAPVAACLRRAANRLRGCVTSTTSLSVTLKDKFIDEVVGGPACVRPLLLLRPCSGDDGVFAATLSPTG